MIFDGINRFSFIPFQLFISFRKAVADVDAFVWDRAHLMPYPTNMRQRVTYNTYI